MQTGRPMYLRPCKWDACGSYKPPAYRRPTVEKANSGGLARPMLRATPTPAEVADHISMQCRIAGQHRLDAYKRRKYAEIMYPEAIR